MFALAQMLPEPLRTKVIFRLGVAIVPMMRYVGPKLVELTRERTVIRVDATRRNRNSYHSLFLGALTSGGDCAAGLFPMKYMIETGHRTIPIVKSATAEYYKRVTSFAHFTCTQGLAWYELCDDVVASGERREITIDVLVTAPAEFGDEPVARIVQVMSVRNLNRK